MIIVQLISIVNIMAIADFKIFSVYNILKSVSLFVIKFTLSKNIFIFCIFIHLSSILVYRGDFLTNINCSLNCIYQKDGKCSYSSITPTFFSTTSDCTYFVDKSEEKTK